MILLQVIAALPVMFAVPEPVVNWTDAGHNALRLEVPEREDFSAECLKNGLELRYRFEMRVCRRRMLWTDGCDAARVQIQSVQYDPISEGYRVSIDLIGDKESPKVTHMQSESEAMGLALRIPSVALSEIGYSTQRFPAEKEPYIGIRVTADCKGDYNETISQISSFITLGLLEVGSTDSGWVDFRLTP
ncbi:MAG: DUF4390 domain-containing protein [Oligoflexia bacterium]|nr:DUF4390 domain-containing protein [Oligoflexia bacterium]